MIDLTTPSVPVFAGCHSSSDTHDTQCVMYRGPDPDHGNREICVSSNEDHVEIADVTVKGSPKTIATMTYGQLGFVHQGWLTEDHRFLLIGDELDELQFGVGTRTHTFDVTDLDLPLYLGPLETGTLSIDHNLYVHGNRIFEANYSSGCACWNSRTWRRRHRLWAFSSIPSPPATKWISSEHGACIPTSHRAQS